MFIGRSRRTTFSSLLPIHALKKDLRRKTRTFHVCFFTNRVPVRKWPDVDPEANSFLLPLTLTVNSLHRTDAAPVKADPANILRDDPRCTKRRDSLRDAISPFPDPSLPS
ncbi:hypothetical protein HZH66_004582 [Vespula vulgaris]|uniref:Uncharacterized protein n=1 Tax=Vespula vulgaris TaxID=7454 RepID=A0A834NA24_VESVU|nr:hypothetical protein HZH66_004582 [Vespula vulgaris]